VRKTFPASNVTHTVCWTL